MEKIVCYPSISHFPEPVMKIYNGLKEDLKYFYKYEKLGYSSLERYTRYLNSFFDWNEIFDLKPGILKGCIDCVAWDGKPSISSENVFNAVRNGMICPYMRSFLLHGDLSEFSEEQINSKKNNEYEYLFVDLKFLYSACLNTAKLIKFYPLNFSPRVVYSGLNWVGSGGLKLPEEKRRKYNFNQFKKNDEFIIPKFICTSTSKRVAISYSGSDEKFPGVLLEIHLQNNVKNKNGYCYARNDPDSQQELEVTISAFSRFKVIEDVKPETKLRYETELNGRKIMEDVIVTVIVLECYGNDL